MSKYWGKESQKAAENFTYNLPRVDNDLIKAIAEVKKAALFASWKNGEIDKDVHRALDQASGEVIAGKLDREFDQPFLQGGAGNSINMNVNEVIANRGQELLKGKKRIHPNDHVNRHQSTNDVNPSALKIVCIRLSDNLIASLDDLIEELRKKAKEFEGIKKVGRTHVQDALPTTLGQEFKSYADILTADKKRIIEATSYMYELNLGGTAIGNSISAPKNYIKEVYPALAKITGLKLTPAANLMCGTSSGADFAHLSSVVTVLFSDLSKIAGDLRFMASGPMGGIGEISLTPLQAGSSIMPGKVNPVMPETINQVYFYILGNNLTIFEASTNAHLELGIMFPVLAGSIISTLKVASQSIKLFKDRCISTVRANKERCSEHLERSTAYATLLVPKLGYDKVSEMVKKAVSEKRTIREVMLENKLLTEKEFDELTNI